MYEPTKWRRVSVYGDTPCNGCAEREPGCHGKCERYMKWKEGTNEIKKKMRLGELAENYRRDVTRKMSAWRWHNDRRR